MSTPMLPSGRIQAITSMLSSGPPRFRFHPMGMPEQIPASMTRSRRNFMFSWRSPTEPTGTRFSGYLAAMQLTIAGPLPSAHPLPLPGEGDGDGAGEGEPAVAGVLKLRIGDQALVVSPSVARTRQ